MAAIATDTEVRLRQSHPTEVTQLLWKKTNGNCSMTGLLFRQIQANAGEEQVSHLRCR